MDAASPIATFLLGLFGTAHCLGMCGPIVLALPAREGRLGPQLLYHLGRISTYAMVCALAGGLGAIAGGRPITTAAAPLGTLARAQVALSLVAAALMLTLGLVRLGVMTEPRWLRGPTIARLPGVDRVRRAAARGESLAMVPLGLLLGLLPCGLSYGAFAAALTAPSPLEAAVAGVAFGVGTLPGLLALGTSFSALVRRHARMVDGAAGVLLCGLGVLLCADALDALFG
jgi:hypothetical protein